MDESDFDGPKDTSQLEQVPDKPRTILLIGVGFMIPILILGFFWNMALLRPSLDIVEAIEIEFNCRASERSGIILCISYVDNLSGIILNNSDDTVFIIKETENSEGAFGYDLKSYNSEWSKEIAVGVASYDMIANYHVYHIFKNATYYGILAPDGKRRTCPKDRHCV